METKLENLIEKLQKEGVEEAKKESARIIREAQRQAEKLLKEAGKEAAARVESAEREAGLHRQNAETAIRQAARDSELALKSRLLEMLDSVFRREVSGTLSPDFMKTMILNLLKQWKEKTVFEITVRPADKKQLEKLLFSGVKKKLKDSIVLHTADELTGGFRIALKGDNVYYDFSDEAIAGALMSFLNPKIREILETHG